MQHTPVGKRGKKGKENNTKNKKKQKAEKYTNTFVDFWSQGLHSSVPSPGQATHLLQVQLLAEGGGGKLLCLLSDRCEHEGYLHLLKSPGKKEKKHISSSDRFPSKPTGENKKHILNQMEGYESQSKPGTNIHGGCGGGRGGEPY